MHPTLALLLHTQFQITIHPSSPIDCLVLSYAYTLNLGLLPTKTSIQVDTIAYNLHMLNHVMLSTGSNMGLENPLASKTSCERMVSQWAHIM